MMFNPLACVNPRFQRRDGEEEAATAEEGEEASPCPTTSSTPRSRSPTTTSGKKDSNKIRSRNSNKINPYSTLGLDKFSTLLADLEERRRKIHVSHPQDHVPYDVQFIYSKSGEWVPIVVRSRDHSQSQSHDEHKHKHKHDKAVANPVGVCGDNKDKPQGQGSTQDPPPREAKAAPDDHYPPPSRCTTTTTTIPINNNNNNNGSSSKASSPNAKKVVQLQQQPEHGKQPTPAASTSASNKKKSQKNSQYLPVALVLSLVFLVMFGRSVAILLTTAWWYLVPTIKTRGSPINPNPRHHPPLLRRSTPEGLSEKNNP